MTDMKTIKWTQIYLIQKQGPCGSFCFNYWLNGGCPEDCLAC